jgi:hypothetical protein
VLLGVRDVWRDAGLPHDLCVRELSGASLATFKRHLAPRRKRKRYLAADTESLRFGSPAAPPCADSPSPDYNMVVDLQRAGYLA